MSKNQEPRKEKVPAVKVILIPRFPVQEELRALVSLAVSKPFREPRKDLLGDFPTWNAAFVSYIQELRSKMEDGDGFAQHKLAELKKYHSSTAESYKQEFKQSLNSWNVYIVTIDWPGLVLMADSELAKKHGLEQGLLDCCWNCGKTRVKLAHCSRCQKARYCSAACQRDAWFHHKYTTSKKYGCA
jgi:hypothetical protein